MAHLRAASGRKALSKNPVVRFVFSPLRRRSRSFYLYQDTPLDVKDFKAQAPHLRKVPFLPHLLAIPTRTAIGVGFLGGGLEQILQGYPYWT